MAFNHLSFWLLPVNSLGELAAKMPVQVPDEMFRSNFFGSAQPSQKFYDQLDAIVPRLQADMPDRFVWGSLKADHVEVFLDNDLVAEIRCRTNRFELSVDFVRAIVQLAKDNQLALLLGDDAYTADWGSFRIAVESKLTPR